MLNWATIAHKLSWCSCDKDSSPLADLMICSFERSDSRNSKALWCLLSHSWRSSQTPLAFSNCQFPSLADSQSSDCLVPTATSAAAAYSVFASKFMGQALLLLFLIVYVALNVRLSCLQCTSVHMHALRNACTVCALQEKQSARH